MTPFYAGSRRIDSNDPWAILVGTGLGAVPGRRLALGLPGAFRFFRGRLSGPSHLLAQELIWDTHKLAWPFLHLL